MRKHRLALLLFVQIFLQLSCKSKIRKIESVPLNQLNQQTELHSAPSEQFQLIFEHFDSASQTAADHFDVHVQATKSQSEEDEFSITVDTNISLDDRYPPFLIRAEISPKLQMSDYYSSILFSSGTWSYFLKDNSFFVIIEHKKIIDVESYIDLSNVELIGTLETDESGQIVKITDQGNRGEVQFNSALEIEDYFFNLFYSKFSDELNLGFFRGFSKKPSSAPQPLRWNFVDEGKVQVLASENRNFLGRKTKTHTIEASKTLWSSSPSLKHEAGDILKIEVGGTIKGEKIIEVQRLRDLDGGFGIIHKVKLIDKDQNVREVFLKSSKSGENVRDTARLDAMLKDEYSAMERFRGDQDFVQPIELRKGEDGRPIIVMEKAGDEDLLLFNQRGDLSEAEYLELEFFVMRTKQKLAEKNLAYLDWKPDNIMIYREASGKLKFRLIDLGLVERIGRNKTVSGDLTKGTPGFLSPEMLRAVEGRPYKLYNLPQSDSYTAGLVLRAMKPQEVNGTLVTALKERLPQKRLFFDYNCRCYLQLFEKNESGHAVFRLYDPVARDFRREHYSFKVDGQVKLYDNVLRELSVVKQ